MLSDLRLYLDKRVARILLLGFISGFPWVLTGTVLTLWLREYGVSRTAVGFAGAITFVYAINFLWAPLIDRLHIPVLTSRFGHRRAWILCLQAAILLCLIAWSTFSPTDDLTVIVFFGLLIAIASASQDITIDALRIEQIPKDNSKLMAVGAAAAVVGWWTGFKLGGAIALFTADELQSVGIANYWQQTILIMGTVIVVCNVLLLFVKELTTQERDEALAARQNEIEHKLSGNELGVVSWYLQASAWIATTFVDPLWGFFKRNGVIIAASILGFVFLFKIGEAFLGRMSILFYQEVGFSKTEIGIYSKGLGWVVTVTFTVLGSYVAVKVGVVRALVIAGLAMAATNLLFSLLYWVGQNELLFAVAVVVDDLTGAIASVVFVAFISLLVDRNYTATQYALLASIGTAGRTVFASGSGWAVDALQGDWGIFFIITALMVLPSLMCLWVLRHKLNELLGGVSAVVRGG